MNSMTLAKRAYSGLTSTRTRTCDDYAPFFELLEDDVVFSYSAPANTPLSGEFHGRPAVVDLFTSTIPELFEEIRLEAAIDYIGYRDSIVALGTETYRIKKTRVRVHHNKFLVALTFNSNRITRVRDIRDLAQFADSCSIEE